MSMSRTWVILCVLSLLAACWTGKADDERAGTESGVGSAGSVSVIWYCEKFAEAYLTKNAIDYTGLSVEAEKMPDIMMWLSNVFQPPDSRFTAGYDCRFTVRGDKGQVRKLSVGIFLTGTLEFAHYTKWKTLQVIPVEHVVDATRGRAGYGVFKYLEGP